MEMPDRRAMPAFEQWWGEQTKKGDPERRSHLVSDAYLAGFAAGQELERDRICERSGF